MDAFARVLRRLIPENIAGLLGVVGIIIPLLKELIIAILRVLGVFIPEFQALIPKVVLVAETVEKVWDNIKRFLLAMPPNPLGPTDGNPNG